MYQYGTGTHAPPGGQHQGYGMMGQGQGWHQPQGQGWQHSSTPPQPQQWGYMRQGQPPPPASDHYGNYGQSFSQNVFSINAWQMSPPAMVGFQSRRKITAATYRQCSSTPKKNFSMYLSAQHLQYIMGSRADELCHILNTNGRIRSYYKISWSLELCKIMIAMLDRNKDGIMQWPEFQELLQCLVFWYRTFKEYDTNGTDYVEAGELGSLIRNRFRYSLSAKALECILKRYSRAMDDGRCLIAFDDFVSMSVRLRAYTEAFRARDRNNHQGHERGSCTFGYDDFLQCTMCL